jgi:hypothetical protein
VKRIEKLDWYLMQIAMLWPDFVDDGLSGGFPDWLYSRWNLRLAGRVHDWHYCSRCHRQDSMTLKARRFADCALRKHARELLPWYLQIAPIVLHIGVRLFGPSPWDSCGDDAGEWCRHNIAQPVWMR